MLTEAKIGDYVLVHVGIAISIIDKEEAKKTFQYLKEIGEIGALTDVDQYLPKDTH
jgi:hydrogenase expression/formation protein HypC